MLEKDKTYARIAKWGQKPAARRLLKHEHSMLEHALAFHMGHTALEIGWWLDRGELLNNMPAKRHGWVAPIHQKNADLVSSPYELGIASDSVDFVLLPHTLELTKKPYALMREAQRVLTDDGVLIILGFNPYGLWGLQRQLSVKRFPAGLKRMWPASRINEWVHLLGFEPLACKYYCYGPGFNVPGMHAKLMRWEKKHKRAWSCLAGGYILVARNRVHPLTLVRAKPTLKPSLSVSNFSQSSMSHEQD